MSEYDPIDFYFEFASPYGYFASLKIDDLAAKCGRTVNIKGEYVYKDVSRLAKMLGIDGNALIVATQDQKVKDRLKEETEKAIARGAFGSPFIFVGDEPFWCVGRLDHVERWLQTGGS